MTSWGPIVSACGPGAVTPSGCSTILFDSGALSGGIPSGFTTHVGQTFVGGHSDAAWTVYVDWYAFDGSHIRQDTVGTLRLTQPSVDFSPTPPTSTGRFTVTAAVSLYQGQTVTFTGSGSWSTTVFCEFGTQPTPGGEAVFFLSPTQIATWCTQAGVPELAIVFAPLYFTYINTQNLCGTGPPPLPPVTLDLLTAPLDVIQQLLAAIIWPLICQCKPGSPPPIPYPEPPVTIPPGWPTPPTFPCSDTDLCSSVVAMQQSLAALSASVSSQLDLIQSLQRYGEPFAYIQGSKHQELSGSGSFAYSRLLGFEVVVTARPLPGIVYRGNPAYIWNLGWCAISDGNGLVDERRITRDSMVWLPPRAALASTFSYELEPGVVASVTELEAER